MQFFDLSLYGIDWALFVLRITVAAIFLRHGFMKHGMWKQQASPSMPNMMLMLMRALSVVEPILALGILFGAFSVISAGALSVVMLGALYFKIFVWKKKFSQDGGWELDLLLLAALSILATAGSGVFSLALP